MGTCMMSYYAKLPLVNLVTWPWGSFSIEANLDNKRIEQVLCKGKLMKQYQECGF